MGTCAGRYRSGSERPGLNTGTAWSSRKPASSIDDVIDRVAEVKGGVFGRAGAVRRAAQTLGPPAHSFYTPEYGLEVHPALLARSGRTETVEHMLWRGQSELLLPQVNEVRLKVCQDFTATYGSDWPIRWVPPFSDQEVEEVGRSPLGTELGHVNYLLQALGVRNPRHDLYEKRSLGDLVLRAKKPEKRDRPLQPRRTAGFQGAMR